MKGVHEDEPGSQFLYAVYRRGSIVTSHDDWGVVLEGVGNKYRSSPSKVAWLRDGRWYTAVYVSQSENISAPYSHTYEGIPDEVLAKATHVMLDTQAEHDKTGND